MNVGRVRLLVLVVAFVAVTPVATGTAGGTATDRGGGSTLAAAAPDGGYDSIALAINVSADGSADWTIEYRYRLEDATARAAFNRTARNVSGPPGAFVDRMRSLAVADAEAATGRSMELGNGSVETDRSVPTGSVGIVRYRFTWTNFAATTDEGSVVVGDALQGLTFENTTAMTVTWSSRLSREAVDPIPDTAGSRSVRWDGPFGAETLRVELAVTDGGLTGLLVPAGVVVLVAVLALAGWYGRSRWRETTAESEAEAVAGGETPEELLSDEERVLRLLEERGGRMKQQDLLAAVEWSRTKTSDVVAEMHEDGQIEKFRLGRENVLALPGEIAV